MPTSTTTYALQKPTVGGDADAWGTLWNANADTIDDLFDGTTAIAPNLVGWKVGGVAVSATAAQLNSTSAAALSTIAGLTPAADRLPYYTGAGTAALATFTAAGRALVDDADAAAQRTTLGLGALATAANVTTAEIAAATLVTAAETIASNNNDTTIPTSAAVKAYADTAVVGAVGLDYLGAIATSSGTTQTLSSLNLALYRFVRLVLNGVGVTFSSNTLSVAGAAITPATVSNSARIRGIVDIELATGTGASNVADITGAAPSGAASIVFGLRTSLSTASTSISVSCSVGAFNAGNVLIYGAK